MNPLSHLLRRITYIFLFASFSIINISACDRHAERKNVQPDVLVILVDALRADHLPMYGHGAATAPFLTEWAKDAMVFDRAYSNSSWTKSSVASLFCSLPVSVHGVLSNPDLSDPDRPLDESDVLSPHAVTIAQALAKHGYRTGAFTTNAHIVPLTGMTRGFDKVDIIDVELGKKTGYKVGDAFLKWVDTIDRDKPYFAYLHYMDVHGPYLPPAEYKDAFTEYYAGMPQKILTDAEYEKLEYLKLDDRDLNHYMARYDADILYWDSLFRRLWEGIKSRKLDRNLLVVVLADHGEAFFEHGNADHGRSLYIEELHVPLIFRMPGRVRAGRFESAVGLMDVGPTILAFLGKETPRQYRGASFAGAFSGDDVPDRDVISELWLKGRDNGVSMVDGDLHWIYHEDGNKIVALFNLKEDPLEGRNMVSETDPMVLSDKAEWFFELLQSMRENRVPPAKVPPNLKYDPKRIEILKGLGYIQ